MSFCINHLRSQGAQSCLIVADSTTDRQSQRQDTFKQISLFRIASVVLSTASTLELSIKTFETYRARAMEKLNLQSRAGLVRYAVQQGWLQEG